ncbi:MAG TPA: hypothetical protein VFR18_08195 [Terriglobia bacterium]|nr:hypothetical protein [Terriglobia bacterium]
MAGNYGDFNLSPDGKLIAVPRQDAARQCGHLVIDLQRAGVSNPLTFDQANDINPVFSPDGNQVAFTSYRTTGPR